jgi:hypothetical protein
MPTLTNHPLGRVHSARVARNTAVVCEDKLLAWKRWESGSNSSNANDEYNDKQ